MKNIIAEQSLIHNKEENMLQQMELDTMKGVEAFREEEARQKLRDERKLVDEIYKQYLAKKHPQYPKSKQKIALEEIRANSDPTKAYYVPIPARQKNLEEE